ncbi:MAG: AraC family transcriptional regulator [Prevotella sp.]|nr:AraC family transcriptional regulator [Prevotella sp.]
METLTLGAMQFTAVVLMTLLTFKLMVPHKRSQETAVATTARWLMATATATLVVHFALQLTLGLRAMGVTQSVMLNLTMLIPASYLISRAVLLLQRHGRLSRCDRWAGPLTWGAAMTMLLAAILYDGQPLFADSPQRQWAEAAGALCYLTMESYYSWRHTTALRAMHRTLNDYYDSDTAGMLRWMQLSIVGLMLLALMVPFAIFAPAEWNGLLFVIAIAIYFFIFYLVDSFCYYLTSNAPQKTQEAEENRTEDEPAKAAQDVTEQTTRAIEQWTTRGGHRKAGITSPVAAAEIGIPRYMLTTWVKANGYESFSRWMTALRIDEAKRMLHEHPDWSTEAVADYCGFTSREYFHRIFKEQQGMTPAQYQSTL